MGLQTAETRLLIYYSFRFGVKLCTRNRVRVILHIIYAGRKSSAVRIHVVDLGFELEP